MNTTTLIVKHFTYEVGTVVEVLNFKGAGQYHVRFPDGKTDVIGKSKLARV